MAAKKPAKNTKAKKKGGKKTGAATIPLSVADHPRARAQVRRAKGWGGIAGFAAGALLSLKAGVPIDQAGERAIAAGFGAYLLAWGCAVTVWRQIALAELKALADRLKEQREAGEESRVIAVRD